MNENLKIDDNTRWVLGAITNDSNQFIKNLRVNPITGALIVEANVTSNNTMIGSTIPGATEGSVLFIGPGGTLAQDNAEFFWDDTNFYLGLGTDTPAATLDVEGTTILNDGSAVAGYVWTATSTSGAGTWMSSGGGGGSGITSINGDTTAAQTLSGASGGYIDIVDAGSGSHTFAVDIAGLTSDSTFISDTSTSLLSDNTFLTGIANSSTFVTALIANTTFTTDLANNSNFYSTLANNTSFISDLTSNTTFQGDIVTIINSDPTVSIDLTSQVTGILPVANGGTGDATFTAYAPVFGGTTSTSPLQSGTVGTTGQVLTSNGAGALPTFQTNTASVTRSNGIATYPGNNTSSTQTIAHGLGTTPKYVRISAMWNDNTGTANLLFSQSIGTYNSTTTATVGMNERTFGSSSNTAAYTDTTNIVSIRDDVSGVSLAQNAVITVNATDITLTWTATGGGMINSSNIVMMFEASS